MRLVSTFGDRLRSIFAYTDSQLICEYIKTWLGNAIPIDAGDVNALYGILPTPCGLKRCSDAQAQPLNLGTITFHFAALVSVLTLVTR